MRERLQVGTAMRSTHRILHSFLVLSSTPLPLQNDYSDTEESAYEKVQRENIMEKEKRLAELGIASEVKSVKKPPKRKTKTSSSEPTRKSRRLADKR